MYAKLKGHYRCLYLNSPAMVAGIKSYLYAVDVDVAHEVRREALVLTSDQSHLVNGRFNGTKMLAMLVTAVEEALKDGYKGLWASGDMTWEFGSDINLDMLLAYERGLEEVFHQQPALSGVCQYHQDNASRVYPHCAPYASSAIYKRNPLPDESILRARVEA